MKKTGTSVDIRTIKNFPSETLMPRLSKMVYSCVSLSASTIGVRKSNVVWKDVATLAISLTMSTTTPRPTRNTSNALVRVGLFL